MSHPAASPETPPTSSHPWPKVLAAVAAVVTLLYFMAIGVVPSLKFNMAQAIVISLGLAISATFIGGVASVEGKLTPGLNARPIVASATGGIGTFVIVFVLCQWYLGNPPRLKDDTDLGFEGVTPSLSPSAEPSATSEPTVVPTTTPTPTTVPTTAPSYLPSAVVTFPFFLRNASGMTCSHRNGSNCFDPEGRVLTPPFLNSDALAEVSIPSGARRFLAILTEFQKAWCTEDQPGNASAAVWIDGVQVKRYEVGKLQNQGVEVLIPASARQLRLTASANGDGYRCDNVVWAEARFTD